MLETVVLVNEVWMAISLSAAYMDLQGKTYSLQYLACLCKILVYRLLGQADVPQKHSTNSKKIKWIECLEIIGCMEIFHSLKVIELDTSRELL